jgi:RHS repeat-associated protein
VQAPPEAATVRIFLFNYMTVGWVAFDDVSLVKAGSSTNLVQNPGFEGSSGWTESPYAAWPGTSVWRGKSGTGSPHAGQYAYVISNHAYGYLRSDPVAVHAGLEYDLYAYVRGELDSVSHGAWIIRAYFYDSAGAQINFVNADSGGPGTVSTTWPQEGGRVTAPPGAATARIYLFSYMTDGWVAFDDVSLAPVDTVIERTTYRLAGRSVAVRVSGDPDNNNNGLFYLYGDHLGSIVGFTEHRHNNLAGNDLGLIYMNARYYVPYLNRFQSRDLFPGYARSPASQNGYSYVNNNPISLVDPSGLCIPEQDAFDSTCIPFLPDDTESHTLFNYTVIPGQSVGSAISYLQVDYQDSPWSRYKTAIAPRYPVLVPVRHPLNLSDADPYCYDEPLDSVRAFTSNSFEAWEVNARNILAEIHGVIASQQEWALRDAIGIAYNPYNRRDYNALPPGTQHYYQRTGFFSGGSDLKALLLASNQYALTTTGNFALDPSNSTEMQKVYEFSLVVAYGVEQGYFRDTSQGAVKFSHQKGAPTDSFNCGETGPAFFRIRLDFSYNLTTAELERQGGWPEPVNNMIPRWLPISEWTEIPPPGCQWN